MRDCVGPGGAPRAGAGAAQVALTRKSAGRGAGWQGGYPGGVRYGIPYPPGTVTAPGRGAGVSGIPCMILSASQPGYPGPRRSAPPGPAVAAQLPAPAPPRSAAPPALSPGPRPTRAPPPYQQTPLGGSRWAVGAVPGATLHGAGAQPSRVLALARPSPWPGPQACA